MTLLSLFSYFVSPLCAAGRDQFLFFFFVPMVRILLHTPCMLFICLTMADADLKYLRHSSKKNKSRAHDIDGEKIGRKEKPFRFQFERTIPRDAAADERVMPLFVKVT